MGAAEKQRSAPTLLGVPSWLRCPTVLLLLLLLLPLPPQGDHAECGRGAQRRRDHHPDPRLHPGGWVLVGVGGGVWVWGSWGWVGLSVFLETRVRALQHLDCCQAAAGRWPLPQNPLGLQPPPPPAPPCPLLLLPLPLLQRTLEELFIKGPVVNTRDNPEFVQVGGWSVCGRSPGSWRGCVGQALLAAATLLG